MSRAQLLSLGLVLAAIALPAAGLANTVLAGNFGPGYSFDTNNANPVGNDLTGVNYAQAVEFTPISSGSANTFWVAAYCVFACPDNLLAIIAANNGGTPGAALETLTIPGVTLPSAPSALSFSLSTPLSLVAGTHYWVVLEADLNDTVGWSFNNTGDTSITSTSVNGGPWGVSGLTPGGYELDSNSSAVPEPSSIGMILSAGVLAVLLRKCRAVRARRHQSLI